MTLFFDIFFGDSQKKIYQGQFNQALRSISDISEEERDYLNEVFAKDLEDGLTAYELKQRIEKLHHNPDDILDSYEVEQVKKKLMEELEK